MRAAESWTSVAGALHARGQICDGWARERSGVARATKRLHSCRLTDRNRPAYAHLWLVEWLVIVVKVVIAERVTSIFRLVVLDTLMPVAASPTYGSGEQQLTDVVHLITVLLRLRATATTFWPLLSEHLQ